MKHKKIFNQILRYSLINLKATSRNIGVKNIPFGWLKRIIVTENKKININKIIVNIENLYDSVLVKINKVVIIIKAGKINCSLLFIIKKIGSTPKLNMNKTIESDITKL